jgi:hypothetical protein
MAVLYRLPCYHALRAADRSKPVVPGLRVRLSLSGVTPGDCEELKIRRVSYAALHADPLTQGQTCWSFRRRFIMPAPSLLTALARSFLAGEATVEGIVDRAGQTLGRNWRWLRPLARRYVESFTVEMRPSQRDVISFFLHDTGFRRAWSKHFDELSVAKWLADPQRMQPVAAAAAWDIPAIESVGALADWFNVTADELLWFADLKRLAYKSQNPRLAHYHYRVLAKKSGAIRLIEAPKPHLKELQRQILAQILHKIPPHPAAHGFVKGRSVQTFIAPHLGRPVVLKMDLQDFFPSITGARIQTIFRMLGYPESVADLLGGICTNAVPRHVWNAAAAGADHPQLQERDSSIPGRICRKARPRRPRSRTFAPIESIAD